MKENKVKDIIIGVLVILIIILGGLFVYGYVFDNGNDNNLDNNNSNNNVNNEEVKNLSNEEALSLGKDLYDKATEIYETWLFLPWCGYNWDDIYNQPVYDFGGTYGKMFYKSPYKNLDELKVELRNYFSEDIINSKINGIMAINWDLKNIETYVNYVIKDNELYCRNFHGKGWITGYVDYEMNVDSIDNAKIVYNIKSKYVILKQGSSCMPENINACSESDFEYKDTKFVIEKNNEGKWIVSSYILHE